MVYLNAYFDMSKGKHGDGLTVVAGYAGQAQQFADIEERWLNYLRVDFPREEDPYFHLHETRDRYVDWSLATEKYRRLLRGSGLYAIAAVVNNDMYAQLRLSDKYRKVFPAVQHVCLDFALSALSEQLKPSELSGPVALRIDNDYGSAASAAGVYDNWSFREKSEVFDLSIAGPGAAKREVPLQFADLLANAVRMDPTIQKNIEDLRREDMEALMRFPLRESMARGYERIWNPKTIHEAKSQEADFELLVAVPDGPPN